MMTETSAISELAELIAGVGTHQFLLLLIFQGVLELILKIIVFGDLANTAYSDWASVSNRGGNSA